MERETLGIHVYSCHSATVNGTNFALLLKRRHATKILLSIQNKIPLCCLYVFEEGGACSKETEEDNGSDHGESDDGDAAANPSSSHT